MGLVFYPRKLPAREEGGLLCLIDSYRARRVRRGGLCCLIMACLLCSWPGRQLLRFQRGRRQGQLGRRARQHAGLVTPRHPIDRSVRDVTVCDSRAQVPLRQLQAIARSVARFDFPLCLYSFISIFSCLRPSCSWVDWLVDWPVSCRLTTCAQLLLGASPHFGRRRVRQVLQPRTRGRVLCLEQRLFLRGHMPPHWSLRRSVSQSSVLALFVTCDVMWFDVTQAVSSDLCGAWRNCCGRWLVRLRR
jgi:hypothetical protein